MDYRRFDDQILVRMDPGEEILEQLAVVAEKEKIRLASVQALGAVNDFTAGVFHTGEKKYAANRFQGNFEIVSLTGTISTMDGKYYAHLHMSAGDERGERLWRTPEPGSGQRHLRNGDYLHPWDGGKKLQ